MVSSDTNSAAIFLVRVFSPSIDTHAHAAHAQLHVQKQPLVVADEALFIRQILRDAHTAPPRAFRSISMGCRFSERTPSRCPRDGLRVRLASPARSKVPQNSVSGRPDCPSRRCPRRAPPLRR